MSKEEQIFKALADKTRLEVLNKLIDGECCKNGACNQ